MRWMLKSRRLFHVDLSSIIVWTKPRNVYDVGEGEGSNDEDLINHESEPLNLNVNQDPNNVDYGEDIHYAHSDIPTFEVQQPQ